LTDSSKRHRRGLSKFLERLAKGAGIENPSAEDLARFDQKQSKKTSDKDWTHPYDPDAQVARMKKGNTHMAHISAPGPRGACGGSFLSYMPGYRASHASGKL